MDNLERDEKERAETMRQEEQWKEEKAAKRRKHNTLAQQKHRKKKKAEEIKAGVRNKDGKKLPVSHTSVLETVKLTCRKVITETDQEIQAPSRAQVAAASRPRKAILGEIKQREKKRAGKVYTPSKRDADPLKNINWMSPTFWPIIDAAAKKQGPKANISKLVRQLQERDPRFKYFRRQSLSEWRDKTVKDRWEWTQETIAAVKREFLPGGHQTRYNVFVSIFKKPDT